MSAEQLAVIREQLLDRRQRLEAARGPSQQEEVLHRLLRDVDAALDRIQGGSYGFCQTCRDPIEPDRLAADPLLRYCLDHLTPRQHEALQQDLDLSRRVQSDLLPQRQLRHQGWEVAYHYQPAGPVSGDYCDLNAREGGLHFFLGDVMGKGLAASLLMSHLHAIFRSLVPLDLSLGELLGRANRVFCDATGGQRYATLICGWAGTDGQVEICNAGHCLPLHLTQAGPVPLPPDGLPVGLFCEAVWVPRRLRLEPGETLLLYTDGVTESHDREEREYGAEGLARAAGSRSGLAPAELVEHCLQELSAFRSGVAQQDDFTLLAIRRGARGQPLG